MKKILIVIVTILVLMFGAGTVYYASHWNDETIKKDSIELVVPDTVSTDSTVIVPDSDTIAFLDYQEFVLQCPKDGTEFVNIEVTDKKSLTSTLVRANSPLL